MNSEKYTTALWIAAAGAVLAWPFGELVGMVLGAGQDGPGRALAAGFGGLATIAVWVISTVVIIWKLRKGSERLSKNFRAAVALSIAVLPVIAIVSAANHQQYDLRVWNETGETVDDVSVRMVGREHSFGAMRSDITATRAFQQDRPKGTAEVRWSSADGQPHQVEVDLSGVIPRRYHNGVLTFTLTAEDDVRVGFFIRKRLSF